ncbi:hypothetical protein [Streptomyces sp. F001]|uniref:hypothetical protein n=1 Tax=Streptomyces sp. F001 TaxID=1510026 RepID=UPI001F0F210B|nr:hypothetical protein [Streptomyces sp. F001]
MSAARRADSSYIVRGSSTKWHCPPWNSIRRHFSALVVRGMTAMKGTPISFAKYASETAVEPLEASITGRPAGSSTLHRP